MIGGGPAGIAAALEAARYGDRVTLLERATTLGGQLRARRPRARAHRDVGGAMRATCGATWPRAGVDVRLGTVATTADADGRDLVVVATGARPFTPPLAPRLPFRVVQAWRRSPTPGDRGTGAGRRLGRRLRGPRRRRAAGGGRLRRSSSPPAAWCPGEDVHQYQRNLYLARLDEAGVAHPPPPGADAPTAAALRHVFSGREEQIGADRDARAWRRAARPTTSCGRALEGRPGVVAGGRRARPAIGRGGDPRRHARRAVDWSRGALRGEGAR